MSYTVRALEKSDRETWSALFRAYLHFYEVDPSTDHMDRVWDWIFDPNNDFWCVLAIAQSGHPIGLAHYQLMHNTLTGKMTCYLADLFVDPEQRGQGVGRHLIDEVLSIAKGQNLPTVDWLTEETNHAGRRLYDTYQPKTDLVFYTVPTGLISN